MAQGFRRTPHIICLQKAETIATLAAGSRHYTYTRLTGVIIAGTADVLVETDIDSAHARLNVAQIIAATAQFILQLQKVVNHIVSCGLTPEATHL